MVMACSKSQLSACMKCKNLSVNEKIVVLDYTKQHTSQECRKIAKYFNVDKRATATIFKKEILKEVEGRI